MRDWLKRPIALYADAGRCSSKTFASALGVDWLAHWQRQQLQASFRRLA